LFPSSPSRLRKKYLRIAISPQRLKATSENKPLIAAVNAAPPKIKGNIEFFRNLQKVARVVTEFRPILGRGRAPRPHNPIRDWLDPGNALLRVSDYFGVTGGD
jgi:hypothetical protein